MATRLAALLLLLVALAHLLRLVLGTTITIGTYAVPMWVSVVAVIVPAGLAVGLWREGKG